MWKMQRSALFTMSSSLLKPNRFGAYSKRLFTVSSPSVQPKIDRAIDMEAADKSKKERRLFQVLAGFTSFAAVGTVLASNIKLKSRLVEKKKEEQVESVVEEIKEVSIEEDKLKFEEWMLEHGRVYKNAKEKQKRFLIFQEELRTIEAFYRDKTRTYTIGLNDFSDMSSEEFHSRYLSNRRTSVEEFRSRSLSVLPEK